jgi:hypothetical protein
MTRRWHLRVLFLPLAASTALLLSVPDPVLSHSPDPVLGGALWGQGQLVRYRWRAGQVPPSWMQSAVNAAASDSNRSRSSRAAVFGYDGAGASPIAYGEPTACGVNGIACFSRAGAPTSFAMWFRRHGHVFDWGPLRWCQYYSTPPDGCFDAENVALDEFGHVEILAHHWNYADNSDYLDAVVQTVSRAKPRAGWNAHQYGRCDRATLQRKYDMLSSSSLYSTCLDLNTTLSLASSSAYVSYGVTVSFTATLRVSSQAEYERLAGNPLSGRPVVLQRRIPGGTWGTYATMSQGTSAGTYAYSLSLSRTYEWRAVFRTPSNEGLNGDYSPTVTVTVAPCGIKCPSAAPGGVGA